MKRRFSIPQFLVYLVGFAVAGGAFMTTKPTNAALLATALVLVLIGIVYALIEAAKDRKALGSGSSSGKCPEYRQWNDSK